MRAPATPPSTGEILAQTAHVSLLVALSAASLLGWRHLARTRRTAEVQRWDRAEIRSLRRRERIVATLAGIPVALLVVRILAAVG